VVKTEKLEIPCLTCQETQGTRRLKPGFLWLGRDYVECPSCMGTGRLAVLKTEFKQRPNRALVTDSLMNWEK